MKQSKWWHKFWRDSQGKVIIWQSPKVPLWVWFISIFLSKTLPDGQLGLAAKLVAFGSLFTWAWLEIFQGTSYFRRVLGVIVLILTIGSRLK